MFGKVARWLRLFGYDTLYHNVFDDDDILKVAKAENRIILNKDKLLTQRAIKDNIKALYIDEKDVVSRIAVIKKTYSNLKTEIKRPPSSNSLCPLCNSQIIKVKDKKDIKDKIYESTYNQYNDFWKCSNPECEKIYYVGEHWKDFEKFLIKLDNKIKEI